MATTTAAVTLTSDLLSDNMSVSTTTTCMKAGTTADGLDQMDMGYLEIPTGDEYDLFNALGTNLLKSNKVMIANESTDETTYLLVTIDATPIGRLYAGDWMFIPWVAEDATADIELTALGATAKVSYVLFHENRSLIAS
tara:strand:- start:179 stop:595 length:417 start_codon:yes stop_codon:yes gene_type:complete